MPRGIFKVEFRLPPPWARTCLTLFEKGRLDKLQPPLEQYFEKHGFSNVSLRPAAENHCRFLFICPWGGFSVGCSTPTSLDSSRPNPKATVVLPAPLKVCTRNVVSKSGDYEAAGGGGDGGRTGGGKAPAGPSLHSRHTPPTTTTTHPPPAPTSPLAQRSG